MKRKVTIRGYVASNGQVSIGRCDDENLEDRSDLALMAEELPAEFLIREIAVDIEIDVDELFKGATMEGTVTPVGEIEGPVEE